MEKKTPKFPPLSAAPTSTECNGRLNALEDALFVIGGKWKLKVIIALRDGDIKRFNELQRRITGISAKMLSNELKDLEMNGFVSRTVLNQTPVVVEYALTEYSASLSQVLHELVEWGKMHREKIREMRS
ncbi:helix-turn-helix domain-containing protein [Fluviicola sp.]|uniref:winged helix-turn-helix transcriptional regulator n=1 Tax=Fluviicola sp. TaxID=1917219 RepID=UPI0031D7D08A